MSAATGIDGRALRSARSRAAIAAALLACYREGRLRPTAKQVADAAGVSLRTVFAQFADLEQLAVEVIGLQVETVLPAARFVAREGGLEKRARALVASRAALFEAIAPVRRAALLRRGESQTVARALDGLARLMRAKVAESFAPELARSREPLELADTLLCFETWERLRVGQRLSRTRAEACLVRGLVKLLR